MVESCETSLSFYICVPFVRSTCHASSLSNLPNYYLSLCPLWIHNVNRANIHIINRDNFFKPQVMTVVMVKLRQIFINSVLLKVLLYY